MDNRTATINSLTIGAGTVYEWTAWPSGLGSPDIRTDDRARPRRSGVVAADDLYGARTISFEVQVKGTYAEIEAAMSALTAAFAPSNTDTLLAVRLSGTPAEYSLLGRTRGCEWNLSKRFTHGIGDARCVFVATDPVKYGAELTVSIALGTAGPGFTLPASLPAILTGGSTSGVGSVPNAGTAAVEWTATLTGPLTNPRLEDIETGRFLKINATLADGETLVLDSSAGAVLLDGTTPRPNWLGAGSRWWTLEPGANSLRLVTDAGAGSALITYRPGWA